MKKRIGLISLSALLLFAAAIGASAQDVLMNSAETIKTNNFKLAVFPTVLFGENGGDSDWGLAGRFGYGFTRSFDLEVKGAFFKGLNYFGVDAEFWLVHGPEFNFSISAGGHMVNSDMGPDLTGFDASILLSTNPARRLEFYGGLKIAVDSIEGSDETRTPVYAVPGIEYRISSDLDFLAEVGFALNNEARSYASIGLAFYFR